MSGLHMWSDKMLRNDISSAVCIISYSVCGGAGWRPDLKEAQV